MGILRADRITGLGGANAIKGSVEFRARQNMRAEVVNGNADFNLGSGDFTLECWWNSGGDLSTDINFVSLWNWSSNRQAWGMYYDADTGVFGLIGDTTGSGGSNIAYTQAAGFEKNKWYHLAIVRISNTLTLYKNGTSIGSNSSYTSTIYENTVDPLVIGGQLDGTNYDSKIMRGFISNLRIIKGEGIYTGNFTPPTNELTVTPNTVLLACQSPGNILQEATGKKLIAYRTSTNDAFPVASTFTPNSPVGFSTTTDVGGQYGSTFDGFGSFATSTYMVPPGGNTRERNRGRGVVGGGWSPSVLAQIYSVEIATDGTSADFGDLTLQRRGTGAAASHTRGVWAGGYAPGYQDRIDFVTIASEGNAIDFGNLDTGRFESSGVGNDTRGVFGPCENPSVTQNVIQYITFATTGNATDFGDNTIETGTKKQASMCSTTRGLFAGGQNVPSPSNFYDIIEYITTATTGNATDFGDLLAANFMCTGVSDATRGVIGGGNGPTTSGANFNVIQFVTMASTGNAANFGDLTTANQRSAGMSNRTRGLFSGGATPNSSTAVNSIDKITIQTQGNATDFGDYPAYTGGGLSPATQAAGCSDSHGGLS